MGVPALFRWLSKKYPKIIRQVIEEEEAKVPGDDGNDIEIPVDISGPNPNGEEFDSLYLDMNGIVHPCTHPEGKPAPETEEEMMLEIFSYTERVVNMVRPRKLLFLAIDGVAPRAKMNQQRSRRFRSSQEAQEKEDARQESIVIWKSMGKTLSDDEMTKKAWDSNAITPGTPFMDLLASSLRYWAARKLNTDPGWKDVQVIISDASVPGEGEHKIMDFIRRQRSHPAHDPNTRHVIYGLDADLIMLSLATHEPHFRVLREDVFAQSGSQSACRMCGQEGHYAAQCPATPDEIAASKKETPVQKKPFIFLDVAVLREYLEAELKVPQTPFPFNLEQAIDDWVLLIFFVGNDFLPHLPSLEIREGAIDTLLRIWRRELPRMGGYLTNSGHLELARAQIILEGLAQREDEIFKRRRETEERQDQNAKRRKIEKEMASNGGGPSASLNLSGDPIAPPSIAATRTAGSGGKSAGNDFAAKADSIGLGGPKTNQTEAFAPQAVQALAGSNRDVVANRRAIRMANMSAAEVLKAELAGLVPVKPSASSLTSDPTAAAPTPQPTNGDVPLTTKVIPAAEDEDEDFPGLGGPGPNVSQNVVNGDADVDMPDSASGKSPRGEKRKHDVGDAEETLPLDEEDEDADGTDATSYALKVNADGTVEQQDTVRLWEPGYRERYYKQKFGVSYSDVETRKNITTKYIEGMAWVLHYYYQGTPSWQWYYPYHFAPFAADFEDVASLDLKFEIGQPFKPFEQLMGVFPAASRMHIPAVFHELMTSKDSPIIDFYPTTFQIDMNGKRMAWQGVSLLPFIDQTRLLEAMASRYPGLTEEEIHRNKWGNDVLFVGEENSLYGSLEALYGKRKSQDPVPINPKLSRGIHGSLLPNPDCIPGSTYMCPLTAVNLPDIKSDRSLSALFFFPKQLTPHRAVLLPGVQRPRPTLTEADRDRASRNHQERGGPRNQYGQRPPPPGMYQGQNGRSYNDHGRDDGPRGPPNGGYNGGYNNGYNSSYGGYSGNNHNRDNGSHPQGGSYGGYGQNQQSHGSYGGYQGQQPGYQQSGYRGRGGPPQGGGYNRGGGRGGRGGNDGGAYGNNQSYGNDRSYDSNYGAPSHNNHQQGGYGGGDGGQGSRGRGGGRGGYDTSYGGYGGGQSYSNQGGGYGQGNYGNSRGGYNNSGRGRGRQW